MPRVTFTSDPGPLEAPTGQFRAGQTYDLPEASVARWKLRGRVIDAPPEAPRRGKNAAPSLFTGATGPADQPGASGATKVPAGATGPSGATGASDASGPSGA